MKNKITPKETLKDMMFIPDFALHSEPEKIKCVSECQRAKNDFAIIEEELKEGEKQKQLLEVLKNKRVNLEYVKCCETYEQYKTICSYWNEITETEFNLIKEWLKQ